MDEVTDAAGLTLVLFFSFLGKNYIAMVGFQVCSRFLRGPGGENGGVITPGWGWAILRGIELKLRHTGI